MENIAKALERYAEAKNRHDLEATLAICHGDSYYEAPSLGLRVHGKQELGDFYSRLFKSLPDYYGRFDGTAVNDDSVAVWGHFGGTTSDEFMGIPVEPGRQVHVPVSFVCTFRDGLLVADTGHFDASTLAKQLGVRPTAIRPTATSNFVERFQEFWADPDPARVRELVHPDAVAYWPGFDPIRGVDYPNHIRYLLSIVDDRRFSVTDHAETADTAFISWTSSGNVRGRSMEWSGIDRFRLRDGKAIEIFVSYDTAPFLGISGS